MSSANTKSRLAAITLANARLGWGDGWNRLTEDHRDALICRAALRLLMAQDESLAHHYGKAQEFLRVATEGSL